MLSVDRQWSKVIIAHVYNKNKGQSEAKIISTSMMQLIFFSSFDWVRSIDKILC